MKNKEYAMTGDKKFINGEWHYHPEYVDCGLEFGTIFKDVDAFDNDPDAVCYIPECSFDDSGITISEFIIVDGRGYYPEHSLNVYTRKDLEALLKDDNGRYVVVDYEGEELHIEYFFEQLLWATPETYLFENYKLKN